MHTVIDPKFRMYIERPSGWIHPGRIKHNPGIQVRSVLGARVQELNTHISEQGFFVDSAFVGREAGVNEDNNLVFDGMDHNHRLGAVHKLMQTDEWPADDPSINTETMLLWDVKGEDPRQTRG